MQERSTVKISNTYLYIQSEITLLMKAGLNVNIFIHCYVGVNGDNMNS